MKTPIVLSSQTEIAILAIIVCMIMFLFVLMLMNMSNLIKRNKKLIWIEKHFLKKPVKKGDKDG